MQYTYRYYGDFGYKILCIPIEWFDEGFDYIKQHIKI